MESLAFLNHHGNFIYCNPSFLKMLELKMEELIGTPFEVWFESVRNEKINTWPLNSDSLEGLTQYRLTKEVFKYRLEVIVHDSDIDGVFLYIKYTEHDMRVLPELHDIYPHIFNLNPGLSAITTLEKGVHLDVNSAWLKKMGYKKEEVIGKNALELEIWKSPLVRKTIKDYLIMNNSIENFEAKLKTKNKGYIDVVVSARIIVHNNLELCFFSSHDITPECKVWEQKVDILNKIALTDSLTGISNRRHFDHLLNIEWKRGNRKMSSLSIILMDIDFFKSYNDFYGHLAGDDCLRTIAQVLKNSINRPGDAIFRYGGEEFCCILPDTDLEGAIHIAKRLEEAVKIAEIEHLQSSISPFITLSMGVVSTIPRSDEKSTSLVALADECLYKAKMNGRMRIETLECDSLQIRDNG